MAVSPSPNDVTQGELIKWQIYFKQSFVAIAVTNESALTTSRLQLYCMLAQ